MTAIVGGQQIPGSIQMSSKVNAALTSGQTYTVPSNGYVVVQMWCSHPNGYWTIDGQGMDGHYSVAQSSDSGRNVGTYTWGPGTALRFLSTGTGYISGTFFTNS